MNEDKKYKNCIDISNIYSNENYFIKIEEINKRKIYCITNKYTDVIEHMEYALPTAIQATDILSANLDNVLMSHNTDCTSKQVILEPNSIK